MTEIGNPAEELLPCILEEHIDYNNQELMSCLIGEIFKNSSLIYDCVVWCASEALDDAEALKAQLLEVQLREAQR
jgi:hypothetical protein